MIIALKESKAYTFIPLSLLKERIYIVVHALCLLYYDNVISIYYVVSQFSYSIKLFQSECNLIYDIDIDVRILI